MKERNRQRMPLAAMEQRVAKALKAVYKGVPPSVACDRTKCFGLLVPSLKELGLCDLKPRNAIEVHFPQALDNVSAVAKEVYRRYELICEASTASARARRGQPHKKTPSRYRLSQDEVAKRLDKALDMIANGEPMCLSLRKNHLQYMMVDVLRDNGMLRRSNGRKYELVATPAIDNESALNRLSGEYLELYAEKHR